ncbi:TetR family transcriptional regulator [Streptomyces sp. TRM49041]|uniref:TetR/AcrR family transcriptional regulator n=1 Tax=Streptomyces sp. TRM49041 TaxID=2603216 RepID=UPI0011EE754E|nr:TetR family transcriptional regulator [Streptomyces sp. TRM49041]
MPTAREALLDAALAALRERPWSAVRMVDVATAARVSRQTLYNEFGSKDGLARALLCREVDTCLDAVDEHTAGTVAVGGTELLAALGEWLVERAAARPLLSALLTGCWGTRLPAPPPARTVRSGRAPRGGPAQRRADAGGPPCPGDLLALIRDRVHRATGADALAVELALRLAVSQLVAPGPDGAGPLVRTARAALGGLSATSPTAGVR